MIWLRSAVFNAFFYAATILLLIPGIAVRLFAPSRALWVATLWGRTTLWGARVICGIRWVVEGRENLPAGAALIASRHESAFDTFVWLLLVPSCAYVVKAELVRIPLLGPLMPLAGMIPVERAAGPAALRRLAADVAAALDAGRQVVIFPEGTRVPHETPVALQPGIALLASRTGAAVVPVATDSGRLWARRAFRKYPGTVRIRIGKPIPASLPRPEFMAQLVANLQIPPVDETVCSDLPHF
ncbi:MAG TPA: lysophospholipid acyltransferase family protein [Acidisphaera sp.]|nr:lysophospholipid acyltransferase family protein [Acidisphaera sp.]